MSTPTYTADHAIAQSIQQHAIVTLSPAATEAEALHMDLLCASDDSADQPGLTEYWGTSDDGDTWRVHVVHPRSDDAPIATPETEAEAMIDDEPVDE